MPHVPSEAVRALTDGYKAEWVSLGRSVADLPPLGISNAGDPAGARQRVSRHRDIAGINYMALETCFGDMTKDEALQSAELLATELMPHFT